MEEPSINGFPVAPTTSVTIQCIPDMQVDTIPGSGVSGISRVPTSTRNSAMMADPVSLTQVKG
jgi:hypothetical protein